MKDRIKSVAMILLLVALVFSAAYLQWWRCGEMFPHAQFACFIGGH